MTMQFAANLNELNDKLKTMALAIPKYGSLPILACIRIEATDDELILEGTNLEVALNLRMPANVDAPGVCWVNLDHLKNCLPTRKVGKADMVLIDMEDLAPEPETEEEVYKPDIHVYVAMLGSTKEIYGMDGEDCWPDLSGQKTTFSLHCIPAMKKALGFVSTEETRHFLNGVYMHNFETDVDGEVKKLDSVTCVATNGKILKAVRLGEKGRKTFSMIVPTQAVKILTSKFPGEPVRIGIDETQATFEADGMKMITRLIESEYPDYEMVITGIAEEVILSLNREELLRQVKEVSKVIPARAGSHGAVAIETIEDGISLSAKSENGSASGSMAANWNEEFQIKFNPGLLTMALKSIDSTVVTMQTAQDGLGPARLYGDSHDDTVLMPMRL